MVEILSSAIIVEIENAKEKVPVSDSKLVGKLAKLVGGLTLF